MEKKNRTKTSSVEYDAGSPKDVAGYDQNPKNGLFAKESKYVKDDPRVHSTPLSCFLSSSATSKESSTRKLFDPDEYVPGPGAAVLRTGCITWQEKKFDIEAIKCDHEEFYVAKDYSVYTDGVEDCFNCGKEIGLDFPTDIRITQACETCADSWRCESCGIGGILGRGRFTFCDCCDCHLCTHLEFFECKKCHIVLCEECKH